MADANDLPLIDNPHAPEVFGANATGFLNIGLLTCISGGNRQT
jgi:hypothetical protein